MGLMRHFSPLFAIDFTAWQTWLSGLGVPASGVIGYFVSRRTSREQTAATKERTDVEKESVLDQRSTHINEDIWRLLAVKDEQLKEAIARVDSLEREVRGFRGDIATQQAAHVAALDAQRTLHAAEMKAQVTLHQAELLTKDRVIARLSEKIDALERRLDELIAMKTPIETTTTTTTVKPAKSGEQVTLRSDRGPAASRVNGAGDSLPRADSPRSLPKAPSEPIPP